MVRIRGLKRKRKGEFGQIWETVAEDLKDAIIRGDLRPGQRLKIDEITAHYGVSNTPVREAFRYLANLGFVENIPRRMVIVKEITLTDIEDIYVIQTELEGLAAGLATEHCRDKDFKELQIIFQRMEKCLREKNLDHYMKLDVEFHDYLVRLTGNGKLAGMIASMRDQMERFRHVMLKMPERAAASLEEHKGILKAVKARDIHGAEGAMKAHSRASVELLRELVKKGGIGISPGSA